MIDMDLLSVIRRWHFRQGIPIREIRRRTGLSRNTIRKYLRDDAVEPTFKVPKRPSKLDQFAEKLSKHTPSTAAQFGSGGERDLGGLPIPREQFVEAADGMVGDAGEDVGEPCLRIDVVESTGQDQRIGDRRPLATAIRAAKQPRLAPERHAAQ